MSGPGSWATHSFEAVNNSSPTGYPVRAVAEYSDAMDLVLAGLLVFVPLLVLAIVLAIVLRRRSTTEMTRDESRRAGETASVDPESAARGAQGSTAWMRPDGGGS